jgi:hypothetical protein
MQICIRQARALGYMDETIMNILFFYFVLAPRMVFLKPRESLVDLRNILASKQEVKFTREYRRLRKSPKMPFWFCVYTALRDCDLLVDTLETYAIRTKPLLGLTHLQLTKLLNIKNY